MCDKDISNNNFYISKAYNLKNYQKIMHVYIDTYDPKAKKECVNKLNDVYKDIFEKAKQEGIKEIVIPLIGNGNSHFPLDISLKCAIETLYKIASKDNTINVVLSIYKGTQDITLIDNLTEIKYNGENFDK
ncbi:hypothetical protein FACS189459_3060 [Bacilli bacterium]|nr:hypothetical protein FACS189459_3060 [Bacilli bacterium]GHU52325.1 hypothetical protein FACS189496_2270 [Bacilli bacterium]